MTLAERIAELAQAIGADVKSLLAGKANKTTPSLTGPVVVSTVADTAPLAGFSGQIEALEIVGTGAASSTLGLYAVTDTGSANIRQYRRMVTGDIPAGQNLGGFTGFAWNGSSYRGAGQILISADDSVSSTSTPSRISFSTTPIGSIGAYARLTIKNDGKVGIGTTTPTELLDVAGNIVAANLSGTNTGDQIIPTTLPASDVYEWAKAETKPTYTKTEVGLGSTDNTSDADKPVSTAQQAALDLKAPMTAPVFTGPVGVGVGGGSTAGVNGQIEVLQVVGAGQTSSAIAAYSTSDSYQANIRQYRRRATGELQNNDVIGVYAFYGYVEAFAAYRQNAQLLVSVDGTSSLTSSPGRFEFRTIADGTTALSTRMTIKSNGKVGIGTITPTELLDVAGTIKCNAVRTTVPVTKTTAFAVADSENWLIVNGTASVTVTLPAAASYIGRAITIKTISAFTVVSASSNVVPLVGGAAGAALLAATPGKWVSLVSDGTNWIVMQGN